MTVRWIHPSSESEGESHQPSRFAPPLPLLCLGLGLGWMGLRAEGVTPPHFCDSFTGRHSRVDKMPDAGFDGDVGLEAWRFDGVFRPKPGSGPSAFGEDHGINDVNDTLCGHQVSEAPAKRRLYAQRAMDRLNLLRDATQAATILVRSRR